MSNIFQLYPDKQNVRPNKSLNQKWLWFSKIAQWVKVITTKLEDLSLIPGTHKIEGEKGHTQVVLELVQAFCGMYHKKKYTQKYKCHKIFLNMCKMMFVKFIHSLSPTFKYTCETYVHGCVWIWADTCHTMHTEVQRTTLDASRLASDRDFVMFCYWVRHTNGYESF